MSSVAMEVNYSGICLRGDFRENQIGSVRGEADWSIYWQKLCWHQYDYCQKAINRSVFAVSHDIQTDNGAAMRVRGCEPYFSSVPGLALPCLAHTGLFLGRVCFMHGWMAYSHQGRAEATFTGELAVQQAQAQSHTAPKRMCKLMHK